MARDHIHVPEDREQHVDGQVLVATHLEVDADGRDDDGTDQTRDVSTSDGHGCCWAEETEVLVVVERRRRFTTELLLMMDTNFPFFLLRTTTHPQF